MDAKLQITVGSLETQLFALQSRIGGLLWVSCLRPFKFVSEHEAESDDKISLVQKCVEFYLLGVGNRVSCKPSIEGTLRIWLC